MSAGFWTSESPPKDEAGLTPERIDVYHLSSESVSDGKLLQTLAAVLDRDELTRWNTFAFTADRQRFLVSHALVRFALSRHASVQPAAWSFGTNRLGRPEITGPSVANGLRFSLSHTAGLIAVAIARQRDVGVDVENVTRELPIEAAELVLSPAEIERVRGLPKEQKRSRMFALWTLKEAYAKGRGVGLSLPLKQFTFSFDEPPNEISLAGHAGTEPVRWQFELHRPSREHCLALAYDAAQHGKATVRLVPLSPRIDG